VTDIEEPSVVPMLELIGLRAAYGRIEVLHGVDLIVPKGSVVALLGPNGGGKTTTLKVASGQVAATAGCVHIGGRHVNGVSPDALARIGVCTIPEGRGVFPNLTVRENLRMATYGGVSQRDVEERAFTQFPRLGERRNQLAGTMSGGEQQMLAIGRALMSRPKLLMLDEPSMGLAPMLIQQIFDIITEISQQGTTILVVEQNAKQALSRSDRAYVLETGNIVKTGTGTELLDDPSVREAYLGVA
jgi:branched-chain amino acid transport system ATP-binding protein